MYILLAWQSTRNQSRMVGSTFYRRRKPAFRFRKPTTAARKEPHAKRATSMIDDDKPVGSVLEPLRIPQGTSPAFSIVDPAGTWAWRSGPVDAAAVQRRAEAALLSVEAVAQLHAEAAVVELPRRAEAALLPVEAVVQLRAEAAVVELPRRAEAAVQRRAEVALLPVKAAALPRRAEAANAPRWL